MASAQSVRDKCLDESEKATIAACDAALKADPRDAEAYQMRGTAFVRKGETDRAMTDYNAAIRLKPDYALPYFNRGLILESKNQLPQALSDFKRAVELDPADVDSEEAAARVTTALAGGRAPSSPNALPAKTAKGAAAAKAAAAPARSSVAASRSGSPPATTGSAPSRVGSSPARANAAQENPAPVLASAGSETPAIASAPAGTEKGWTFSAAAVGKWISGFRSRQEAAPSSTNDAAPDLNERKVNAPAAQDASAAQTALIETQEYWNDQMALANGGSKDTRRIISLERLGELQKSGILTKQEFENEKRRVLGE